MTASAPHCATESLGGMAGGLETIAALGGRLALALALPPVSWTLSAAGPFGPCAVYEGEVMLTVARRNGRVFMTALAEAGAAITAELANDAMTCAWLCGIEGDSLMNILNEGAA